MKTIDLDFDCDDAFIKGRVHGSGLRVTATDICGVDFDKTSIAECISIRTMIEAHGLTNVLDYIIDEHLQELHNSLKSIVEA